MVSRHIYLVEEKLFYENGKHIGDIAKDVDGYYYWWPLTRTGAWQAYALREIADLLDEMNADWDAEVQAYFEEDKNGIT